VRLGGQSQALASIFQTVGAVLQDNQEALNLCDPVGGNHGDQMVEVFKIAKAAVAEIDNASLVEGMAAAARQLETAGESVISKIYAHGLAEMAEQLKIKQVSLQELIESIRSSLADDTISQSGHHVSENETRKGQVIKCLLAGLAGWNRLEEGQPKTDVPLDFGALVGIGMAYMQAKQRNQERIDVLADATASASPLGKSECHYRSGKIVIKALLQALQTNPI
jgi:hypothetical protein